MENSSSIRIYRVRLIAYRKRRKSGINIIRFYPSKPEAEADLGAMDIGGVLKLDVAIAETEFTAQASQTESGPIIPYPGSVDG